MVHVLFACLLARLLAGLLAGLRLVRLGLAADGVLRDAPIRELVELQMIIIGRDLRR